MITQRRSGTNWVKNLPDYMKYLNNKKREELGWQSPSEVYFGRNINELVRCGLAENRGSPEVRKVSKPTKNDFNRYEKLHSKTRKRTLDSDERVAKRTVKYFRKRNKGSVCKINQKVREEGKKAFKDGMFALEKLKKPVNIICTKLVLEI